MIQGAAYKFECEKCVLHVEEKKDDEAIACVVNCWHRTCSWDRVLPTLWC
jgi:hypothetical protein